MKPTSATPCHRGRQPVPITMGSPRFETLDAGPFRVTRASFVGRDVLDTHAHDRTTFGVMLSGGFELRFSNAAVRRRLHECRAGTVFTEPVAERHANRIGATGASVLVIQPDPDGVIPDAFGVLLDGIHCFRHGAIAEGARDIARELAAPDTLTTLAVHARALEMMVSAVRCVDARSRRRRTRPGWLRVVEEIVEDRFRDALRIEDVAREAGVSASHLAAVFRDFHGTSLGAYVRGRRIDWAAHQLARSAHSVASIALRAGFSDQAHLTRAFKRKTGRTPGEWRRLARGNQGRGGEE